MECEGCKQSQVIIDHLREKLADAEGRLDAVRAYCKTENERPTSWAEVDKVNEIDN